MKFWKKIRDENVEELKREHKAQMKQLKKDWINFKNTGKCGGIKCKYCPISIDVCAYTSRKFIIKRLNEEIEE